LFTIFGSTTGDARFTIARVKYTGGGDWYNDPSIIPNISRELNNRTTVRAHEEQMIVSLSEETLFRYPFLFLTGHGNIVITSKEVENLRKHLTHGGFLYADDDYGMDKYFRREMKKVFPEKEFVELPFDHPMYHILYEFPTGPPKIHKHDSKPPKGYALFHEGRIIVFYTYESNVSDGWADPNVHKDPEEKREKAFQMGVNIVLYALTH
jgi:hypothetical protein